MRTLLLVLAWTATVLAACPYARRDTPPGQPLSLSVLHPRANHLSTTRPRGHQHVLVPSPNTQHDHDYTHLKAAIAAALVQSESFWPFDFGNFGNYGALLIRLAWHCSGSHRNADGRGGCDGARIRFVPERAWDDNTNLDKALRVLEKIKTEFDWVSWGDLIVLAGNVAIETMGGPQVGFCAGRIDDADGSDSLLLGPTALQKHVQPCLLNGNCTTPFGATTIGLIYVNPEGPLGVPDPKLTVATIRTTFGNMGFSDRETVAIIGGGHAFGKTHGACPSGPGPSPIDDPTNPWPGTCGTGPRKGKAENAFTSGFELKWTTTPTKWSNQYFQNLLNFEWEKFIGPGGHNQWRPTGIDNPDIGMLTADVALIHDPTYKKYVQEFATDLDALNKAFAAGWYKLVTRDMGPRERCTNSDAPPSQEFQNPLPASHSNPVDVSRVSAEVKKVIATTPSLASALVHLTYQCASTFRRTDYRGGCNGARIRFPPESEYHENKATGVSDTLRALLPIKRFFGNRLSWSDLIVTAGSTALTLSGGPKVTHKYGRSDAPNGEQSKSFPPRDYYTSIDFRIIDDADVIGLTPRESVALAARPRVKVNVGLNSRVSNKFFQALLSQTWVQPAGFEHEYRSKENPEWVVLDRDVAVLRNPEWKKIVEEFAEDEDAFLEALGSGWTYLVDADLFDQRV
ncbi:heme peroxidase [Rhizoclosmatium globosum]|uniref:Peroxidase n=1 Tax=Rhizoclosmatium globosum TaxID=329046 RepID=A0A1Y2BT84_9FUNG|nr:heme peroxidase [Rhizoclosmatium globosum]|eukprot:ORY37924.1 heme peroxidase [Rhizoclosmatium globosum]